MHSALKREGKRLYHLARQGIEVDREPRLVDVHDINIVEFALPFLTIKTECGRGLYMRSLAHDFGQELGCGAHVSYLKRTRTGPLSLDRAMSLEEFENAVSAGNWRNSVQSLDSILLSYKSTTANEKMAQFLRNGQAVSLPIQGQRIGHLDTYRIYTETGQFLGLIRYDKPVDRWVPFKMFNLYEKSPYFDQED
jgi:tRNA pseudouridine55 synthase